jgi:phage/plasmid-like protein (TIGR03299 family)
MGFPGVLRAAQLDRTENNRMPANIATTNGKPAFAYYGEEPWHRLGKKLDGPATAEEATAAAGLDYEVTLTDVATMDGLMVPKTKAVVRYDNQTVLGVVSDKYVPCQNKQAFGFLDAVVADGGLRYHTAGALGQGETIFLLAKLSGEIRVRGSDDVVEKYLLLANAHDGSAALRVLFTPQRVVCRNTLSMALRQGRGEGIRIRHNGNLAAKIEEAQRVLGLATKFYYDAQSKIDRLASMSPTQAQLDNYFRSLYPDPEDGADNGRAKQTREKLHALFSEGIGHDTPGIKDTWWCAYNAVTEMLDHRNYRGKTEHDRHSNRLKSIWWGSAAKVKEQAWEAALNLAV